MPRSRRRHHSRSRSRSKSHSHDRDRDAKRRKVETAAESPAHKSSVSVDEDVVEQPTTSEDTDIVKKQLEEKLTITPKKTLSPKQMQKKLESEKKRQQKQLEREEREKKKQEEKEKREQLKKEKEELKNKKIEEKNKERELKEEQKRKEREEKEAKRKEKEEREEVKRKEREQEKIRKQQELEEKNREKKKVEEQKQKAAQAFVNFFVPKKNEEVKCDEKSLFMPFQVKSDMKIAPLLRREPLTEEEKTKLIEGIDKSEAQFFKEIQTNVRKSEKTWPFEEDLVIVEEDFGESICEDKQKMQKMRTKFLKFQENRRPPYYGTWRKKSTLVKGRRPLVEDKQFFDYEIDSDEDWEEEEQGESLNGSDDEEKENEPEDDYEVDNEFFVPHGHLSDDEIDDETTSKLSPESLKQKLKLLKDEFDQDMQTKTNKMKPRSIGCIWYRKNGSVDNAIDRHLKPLAMITNGQIILPKRKDFLIIGGSSTKRQIKELKLELVPAFLKLINGNVNKQTVIAEEFLNLMQNEGQVVELTKSQIVKNLKQFAQWKKNSDNKYCWCIDEDVKKKYNLL